MVNGNVVRRIYACLWRSANPLFRDAARRAPIRASFEGSLMYRAARSTFTRPSSTRFFSIPPKSSRYVLTRGFASGGFFALGMRPSSSATEAAITTCTNSVEKGVCVLEGRKLIHTAHSAWKRNIHGGSHKRDGGGRRSISSTPGGRNNKKGAGDKPDDTVPSMGRGRAHAAEAAAKSKTESPAHQLLDRLPNLSQYHRPTKDELLAAATGFWSRMKVRFKWFSIRSLRPYNTDDISAFISWVLVGHVIWIIVGTTTFFSIAILLVNTVFAQETLARWIGNYLTKSSGITVVFESAVVPKWKDGVITFTNVFVSRRPGQGNRKVSKGSSTSAAAAAAAAAAATGKREDSTEGRDPSGEEQEEDTNYTQFDLTINTVNVTLSFAKWFDGKGLLRDVEVKGIRGVVDRAGIKYSGDVDFRIYRHEHNSGDFELDSFKMEDLLVTVHQPNGFRPFNVSIYSCELPQLRKQWLFYDFLSANTMNGSIDNSLFTIHPRQTHSVTGARLINGAEAEANSGRANPWKRHSRLRIDGLNIDHLNRGVEGPFSWINEGNVDIIADIMFPAETDDSIAKVMSDFYDRMEATVTSNRHLDRFKDSQTINSRERENTARPPGKPISDDDDKRFLVMDLRIHLNDVRAAVPIFNRDLSYVNNALVRPIVAYINSRRTFIPITCRVVKRTREFDGSWTPFDSGLMEDLSAETYEAFARNVVDDQARMRRLKKVGLWSLQLAVQALFMGIAGNITRI
ncbi:MAG: Mitochondrial distribution and morphology protein 31, mitochondrial precursor [Geoglossum simile]|nr:MAG: Mitochondrial distribution and morphology protein 31, mitochondrial precursor [Geoglossum simile]